MMMAAWLLSEGSHIPYSVLVLVLVLVQRPYKDCRKQLSMRGLVRLRYKAGQRNCTQFEYFEQVVLYSVVSNSLTFRPRGTGTCTRFAIRPAACAANTNTRTAQRGSPYRIISP